MGKSCTEAAQTLVECIKNSPCVKNGNTIRECMNSKLGGVDECSEYRYAYFSCRRGMLDMRTRIQGEKYY